MREGGKGDGVCENKQVHDPTQLMFLIVSLYQVLTSHTLLTASKELDHPTCLLPLLLPLCLPLSAEHGGRDRHFCIGVADLDKLASLLEAASVPFTRSMSGRPAIFFRDPDANCLECVELEPWR